jgi:hypothetical protein
MTMASLLPLILLASAEPRLFSAPPEHALGERALLQRHLSEVESTLRGEMPVGLTEAQAGARAALLDALHDYWTRGVFPRNRDFGDRRVPYFIDDSGTACAVGHLMIASGAADLAREIATYENNDFVAEIDHPGLASWLVAHGLTAEEAAWIQPTYSVCDGEPPVCGVDGETYECEEAAACAGVDVDYVGVCGNESASDTDTDIPGDIEAEDVCEDGKGCTIGGGAGPLALLVLGATARARRGTRRRS